MRDAGARVDEGNAGGARRSAVRNAGARGGEEIQDERRGGEVHEATESQVVDGPLDSGSLELVDVRYVEVKQLGAGESSFREPQSSILI